MDLAKLAKFPVIILVSGVDGAGRGETVNLLNEWMDPRFIQTHGMGEPSDEELDRPMMWRFWRELPPKGRIGIFSAHGTPGRFSTGWPATPRRPTSTRAWSAPNAWKRCWWMKAR